MLPFLEGLEGLTNGNSIVFVKETICLPSFSLVIRFLEFRVWTVSVDFAWLDALFSFSLASGRTTDLSLKSQISLLSYRLSQCLKVSFWNCKNTDKSETIFHYFQTKILKLSHRSYAHLERAYDVYEIRWYAQKRSQSDRLRQTIRFIGYFEHAPHILELYPFLITIEEAIH